MSFSPGLRRQIKQKGYKEPYRAFAIALSAAIAAGIFVAWTPQFWGVAVLHTGILITTFCWLIFAKRWEPFSIAAMLLAGTVGLWGWFQIAIFGSAAMAATRTATLEWTVAVVAFFLASQILRKKEARSLFLGVILWSATAFTVLAILQMYSSPNEVLWLFPAERYTVGTFLYKNQFVAMIEFAMPIALYWMLFKSEKRFAGAFACLALFAGAIASGSRAGASLTMAECIFSMILAYRGRKLRLVHFVALPAITIVLVFTAFLAGNEDVWVHFQEVRPDAVRQELLKSTIRMYRDEPWSGYGLGAWSTVYPKYATFDVGRAANAAHNDWAEWGAEGGIIFLGGIFGLFALAIRPAIRCVWGLGVIAVMLHSWVDYPTREPVLCILWFCLTAAVLQNREKSQSEEKIPVVDN